MDASVEHFDDYKSLQPKWLRKDEFAPLYDVNAQCLELLVNTARTSKGPASSDLIRQIQHLLNAMTPAVQARAAQSPFLLVDLKFRDDDWWHAVTSQPNKKWQAPAWLQHFRRSPCVKLARSTLMLAWYSVRVDHDAATIALGVTPSVREIIGQLHLHEIDQLAERQFRHLRPRWEDRPAVWKQLLRAAQAYDIRLMSDFILHGMQLSASELIPHCVEQPKNECRS